MTQSLHLEVTKDASTQYRKMHLALRNIVNVLGPDSIICDCTGHDDDGLREEAAEALRLAKDALLP